MKRELVGCVVLAGEVQHSSLPPLQSLVLRLAQSLVSDTYNKDGENICGLRPTHPIAVPGLNVKKGYSGSNRTK